MVINDTIIAELKLASLYAETSPADPRTINGGTEVRNIEGIRIFSRGFSITATNGAWIVKLPSGQFIEEYLVKNSEEVAPLIIKYYKDEQFI